MLAIRRECQERGLSRRRLLSLLGFPLAGGRSSNERLPWVFIFPLSDEGIAERYDAFKIFQGDAARFQSLLELRVALQNFPFRPGECRFNQSRVCRFPSHARVLQAARTLLESMLFPGSQFDQRNEIKIKELRPPKLAAQEHWPRHDLFGCFLKY